ncbi:MAG: hypothetical protein NDF58_07505 [archaeon YNP-LCB-024-027]|jgi:hypothetical protein|nr:hypothetical protein [Candidatus Culexarchaeum yellowstonense]
MKDKHYLMLSLGEVTLVKPSQRIYIEGDEIKFKHIPSTLMMI